MEGQYPFQPFTILRVHAVMRKTNTRVDESTRRTVYYIWVERIEEDE